MRITALILSGIGAVIAVAAVMLELSDWVFLLSGLATSALLLFALWPRKRDVRIVLELGGLQWTE